MMTRGRTVIRSTRSIGTDSGQHFMLHSKTRSLHILFALCLAYLYGDFRAFYAVIIGSKGTTKKRIEGETKTQIKVPKQGEHGPIEITGSTREAVSSSRRRVDLIILSARKKFDITHFMCVPIVQRSIKDNYLKFKVTFNLFQRQKQHSVRSFTHLALVYSSKKFWAANRFSVWKSRCFKIQTNCISQYSPYL